MCKMSSLSNGLLLKKYLQRHFVLQKSSAYVLERVCIGSNYSTEVTQVQMVKTLMRFAADAGIYGG